jgi:hypothetical protein
MFVRLFIVAAVSMSAVSTASAAKCITDQPLDAAGRAPDKSKAMDLAQVAWQRRVAETVGNGEKFDPSNAQRWKFNIRLDKSTGEYIVNVSGIPCY